MRPIDADALVPDYSRRIAARNSKFEMIIKTYVSMEQINKASTIELDLQPTCNQLATDCISRKAAIDAALLFMIEYCGAAFDEDMQTKMKQRLEQLSPVQLDRKVGKWINHSDDGYVECPFCGSATNCDDNVNELHYCFSCGAKMGMEAEG